MATTKVTVTGLTAQRMLQIEAQSIVSATVNSSGHLILKNHAGATFDVGSIQGPTGATGATGQAGSINMINGKTGGSITLTAADLGAVPTSSQAATGSKGLVELATSAETIAGTDAARAVTPLAFSDGIQANLPTGSIIIIPGSTSPAGSNYWICDGRSVLRTAAPDLYSALGTRFGAVDGTHFNIPNLKGRVVVAQDGNQTEFDTIGEVGGTKTHGHKLDDNGQAVISLQAVGGRTVTMRRVAVDPTVNGNLRFDGGNVAGIDSPAAMPTGAALTGQTASASSLQPYMVLNYAIKWR